MRAGDPADLLACLGPPHDLRIEGGTSYFLYRMDFRRHASTLEPRDRTEPVVCQAVFALDEREIVDVAVRGRTRDGLNADARCTVVIGACFVEGGAGASRRNRALRPAY